MQRMSVNGHCANKIKTCRPEKKNQDIGFHMNKILCNDSTPRYCQLGGWYINRPGIVGFVRCHAALLFSTLINPRSTKTLHWTCKFQQPKVCWSSEQKKKECWSTWKESEEAAAAPRELLTRATPTGASIWMHVFCSYSYTIKRKSPQGNHLCLPWICSVRI